jgi:aquaporin Z
MGLREALRRHWPEYLIEGWALGCFMIAAGTVATALEYPASPLRLVLPDADLRRALAGLAMGLTAIALVYSPWGKRSGAHMNPAVTLAFLSLGRIRAPDAVGYIAAQFIGGAAGVFAVYSLLGPAFAEPPVSFAATMPGSAGVAVAFAAECMISAGMMVMVLAVSSSPRFASFTGVAAGCLVACYITFEGPLSGMSMNPARSVASALPALMWQSLWIYLLAPVIGMLTGASLYRLLGGRLACAKLLHPAEARCIHCGHEATPASALSSSDLRRALP